MSEERCPTCGRAIKESTEADRLRAELEERTEQRNFWRTRAAHHAADLEDWREQVHAIARDIAQATHDRDRYREALRAIAGANPAEVITRELSMAAEAALESTDHAEKRHDPDLEGGEDE